MPAVTKNVLSGIRLWRSSRSTLSIIPVTSIMLAYLARKRAYCKREKTCCRELKRTLFEGMSTLFDIDPPYLLDELYPEYVADLDAYTFVHSAYLRPLAHNFTDIQYWIKINVQKFDLTPTSWAKRAGIAPSTLNRFLEGSGSSSLNAKTIEKLSDVIRSIAVEETRLEWESVRSRYETKSGYEIGEAALLGSVGGNVSRISGGNDAESDEDDLQHSVITIPVPRPFEYIRNAAFEMTDDEASPVFQKDDLLVCVPLKRAEHFIRPDDYVIWQSINAERQICSETRQFVKDPSGREWLMPTGAAALDSKPAFHAGPGGHDSKGKATFVVVGFHRVLTRR